MNRQSKRIITITAGVLLVAVIITVAVLFISESDRRNYRKHMDQAQCYMDELQYEQAIAEYEAAIAIDPNNTEAYQALAELYMQTGDYEAAEEVLSRGIAQTASEELAVRLEEVRTVWKVEQEAAEQVQDRLQEQQELQDNIKVYDAGEEAEYLDDGTFVIHEYDANGNVVKDTCLDTKGFYYIKIYEYDENDNCVKEITYESYFDAYEVEETVYGYKVYEYDEDNHCVKETNYEADGTVYGYKVCEYDENDHCIKETNYGGYVSVYGDELYYEYDENDRCVKKSIYKADGTVSRYIIYEYDENDNRVKESEYGNDGKLRRIDEYDANGNQVKVIWYKADGTVECYQISEYNADGKFVKTTRYHADGSIDYIYYADGSVDYVSE